jgi:hypothetical protein
MNAPNENNEDANVVKFSDWDKERIAELFYKKTTKALVAWRAYLLIRRIDLQFSNEVHAELKRRIAGVGDNEPNLED